MKVFPNYKIKQLSWSKIAKINKDYNVEAKL